MLKIGRSRALFRKDGFVLSFNLPLERLTPEITLCMLLHNLSHTLMPETNAPPSSAALLPPAPMSLAVDTVIGR